MISVSPLPANRGQPLFRRCTALFAVAPFLLLLIGCSQDPKGPAPAVPTSHAADSPQRQARDLVGRDLPNAPSPEESRAVRKSEGPGTEEGEMGEKIFTATCSACHGLGIAGAPKFGDAAAWKPRIAKGMETLLKHAMEGFQGTSGMMPAKGGNAALSHEEVAAAVKYMVDGAR